MTPHDATRLAFEEWHYASHPEYVTKEAEAFAWVAWQAALASARAERGEGGEQPAAAGQDDAEAWEKRIASKVRAITLNGSTTGGLLGSWVRLTDAITGKWMLEGFLNSSGAEATPFS